MSDEHRYDVGARLLNMHMRKNLNDALRIYDLVLKKEPKNINALGRQRRDPTKHGTT